MVWATLEKYDLQVGNMKFNTQNEECINICTVMSNFISVFFNISCAIKNMLIVIGKVNKM